jgi:predicted HNH restriction endonuclease
MEKKFCQYCKTTKPISEFYKRRGKEGGSSYCKPCTNSETSHRAIAFKERCVEYKGGKCEICGYNKYFGALEFHHKDPSQKDLQISKVRTRTFTDKIKKELDKCQILCSNCHREIHFIENKKKTYKRKQ